MHVALRLAFCFLDLLGLLYLLDYFTFCLSSSIFELMFLTTLHLNQWFVFRCTVIVYLTYRVGFFSWKRYKIYKRLSDKKEDLLDRHGRLHEKLKITPNPVISAEEVGELSIAAIREKLNSKQMTAVDLIDAYQRRVLNIFRSKAGIISEIIFDADVYAILADSKLESESSSELGPLHGIPVSIQELFPVRGYDHTMGYTSRTNKPAEEDCAFVAALRNTGAIPFLLTNCRQKLIGLTSESPIFGHSKHPTHEHRACISGDSALLVYKGTPLSFVADIIGGARLSAASCGLAGFKPSPGRMSQKGLELPLKLPRALGVLASPIGHNMKDVTDVFRSLWSSALFKVDQSLCPIEFNETKFSRGHGDKLRIGFYTGFDSLLPASPAVERVMQETKHYLESQGHTVVDFTPPEIESAYELVISLLQSVLESETLKLVYKDGHGDILVDYKQRAVHLLYALPNMLRRSICKMRAKRVKPNYAVTSLALRGYGCTESYTELECKADNYIQQFFEQWNDEELDCLVCPVSPLPATWDHSAFYVVNCVFLYTALYNMLGCPAGTVQCGRVEQTDINLAKDAVQAGPNLSRLLMFAQQLDAAQGLPINVQVVAKPWDDELALGLLHSLESGMRKS